MLEGAMIVWFALTGVSVLFLAWDLLTNAPVSWVQKLGWLLVVFYTGPLGLVMYLLACRRPFPGGHAEFTRPSWKQGVNSEVHCLAGDATGILIAASIVPAFGLANGWDLVIEYLAGFVCGLFIFQALMMIGMFNGRYFLAVRKTFFSEAVSMNFVMAGMIPTMVLLAGAWPESMEPTHPSFWFRMSMASVVGGIIAFPINHWLVRNHLKHGCMTLPGADPAPDHGRTSSEPSRVDPHAGHDMSAMKGHEGHDMSGMKGHAGHDMSAMKGHEGHDMSGMKGHEGHDMSAMKGHEGHDMSGMKGHEGHDMGGMQMKSLPMGAQVAWVLGTLLLVIGATMLTGLCVPITF